MWDKVGCMYRKKPVMFKMAFSYIVLGSFLISAFSVILAERVSEDFAREIRKHSEETIYQSYTTADLLMNNTFQYFYQVFHDDPIVSEALYGRELDRIVIGRIHARLNELLSFSPMVHSVYVYNFQDDLVFSTLSTASGLDRFYDRTITQLLSESDERRRWLMSRKTSFSIYNRRYNDDLITVIYSESTPDSFSHGSLVLNLNQNVLQQLVNRDTDNKWSAAMIVDGDGTVISHPDPERFNTNIRTEPYFQELKASSAKTGHFLSTADGRSALVTFVKSDQLDWSFVGVTDYQGALGRVVLLRRFIYAIAGVFASLGVIAALVFTRRFYRPIHELLHQVHDPQSPSEGVRSLSEYDVISRSVDSMRSRISRLQTDLRQHLPESKKAMLLAMCRGERWNGEEAKIGSLQLSISEGDIRVSVIRLDGYPRLLERFGMGDVSLLKFAIANISDETMKGKAAAEIIEDAEDRITILWNASGDVEAERIMEKIRGHIEQYLKLSVTIGVGVAVHSFGEVRYAWNTAAQAANYRLVFGGGQTLKYEDIHAAEFRTYEYPLQCERFIVDALKSGNIGKVREAFEQFIDRIRSFRFDEVLLSLNQLMVITMRTAIEMVDDPREEWLMELQDAHNQLRRHDTLSEITEWYMSLASRIVTIRDRKATSRHEEQVDKLMELIHTNYPDPNLSVASLAEAVGLSTNYARKIFRDRMGQSISQYINDYRFRKAQEMLIHTELPANRIGELVGMNNASYFYVSFKRFSGKTPDHYRKAYRMDEREETLAAER